MRCDKYPLNQLDRFTFQTEAVARPARPYLFFDIQTAERGLIGAMDGPATWAISFSRPTERGHRSTSRHGKTHISFLSRR